MGQSERLVTDQAPTPAHSLRHHSTERASGSIALRLGLWRADLMAISVLLGTLIVTILLRWLYPNWLIDPDIYTMFLPWFGYIGDRSASFEAAAWMPAFFGGSAMVGNPSSGWLYLPVMVIFALFEVLTAYKVLVIVQLLIGGAATYALFRRVGLIPLAAMTGTAVFVFGPLHYSMTRYLVIIGQTNTWIPVALLGAEMSLRASRLSSKLGWGALIGIALTQIFSAWPSQGIMYSGIWLATWCLFRTFVQPILKTTTIRERMTEVVVTGAAAIVSFFGFGAAAILPLIDYSGESSIPGGDYSQVLGSDYASAPRPLTTLFHFFMADNFSIRAEGFGAAVVVMALLAMLIARKEPAVLYFAAIFILASSLPLTHSPTRWLLDLLPPFYHINGHRPVAVIWVIGIAPAFLVGALIQRLTKVREEPIPRWSLMTILGFSIVAVAMSNASEFRWIGWFAFGTMLAALMIFAAMVLDYPEKYAHWKGSFQRNGVIGLVAIAFLFPTGGDVVRAIQNPIPPLDGFNGRIGNDAELNEFIERGMAKTDPGTAAEFLQLKQETEEPFRYTGYTGQGYPNTNYSWIYNSYWWHRYETGTQSVLANGRALRLGLEQTSGYNPVQLMFMYEYINIMNGAKQDYHWGDVFAHVLAAPDAQMLDMLNMRYLLVDASLPANRWDILGISQAYVEVYRDEDVVVYENPRVFPRAWMVHDVQPNDDGVGMLDLRSGEVNGRTTAFVDGELPTIQPAANLAADGSVTGESVIVVDQQEETMTLEATGLTDSLVVISAAYSDGWNAYIDGEQVPIVRTNHALQGVAVPAGTHTIELKYEPRSLEIGLWTTGAATIGILGVWSWALVDIRRRSSDRISTTTSTGGSDA